MMSSSNKKISKKKRKSSLETVMETSEMEEEVKLSSSEVSEISWKKKRKHDDEKEEEYVAGSSATKKSRRTSTVIPMDPDVAAVPKMAKLPTVTTNNKIDKEIKPPPTVSIVPPPHIVKPPPTQKMQYQQQQKVHSVLERISVEDNHNNNNSIPSNASSPIELSFRHKTTRTANSTSILQPPRNVAAMAASTATKELNEESDSLLHFTNHVVPHKSTVVHPTTSKKTNADTAIATPAVAVKETSSSLDNGWWWLDHSWLLFGMYTLGWLGFHVMISTVSDGVLMTPFWKSIPAHSHEYLIPRFRPVSVEENTVAITTTPPPPPQVVIEEEIVTVYQDEIIQEVEEIIVENKKLKDDYFSQLWNQYLQQTRQDEINLARQILQQSAKQLEEHSNNDILMSSFSSSKQHSTEIEQHLKQWNAALSRAEDTFDHLNKQQKQKQQTENSSDLHRNYLTSEHNGIITHLNNIISSIPNFNDEQLIQIKNYISHWSLLYDNNQQKESCVNTNISHEQTSNIHHPRNGGDIVTSSSSEVDTKLTRQVLEQKIQELKVSSLSSSAKFFHSNGRLTFIKWAEDMAHNFTIAAQQQDYSDHPNIVKNDSYKVGEINALRQQIEEFQSQLNQISSRGLSVENVQHLIDTAMANQPLLYQKDYASIRMGASVIVEKTSPSLKDTLPLFNRWLQKSQLRFYGHGPHAALQPTYPIHSLGQCWSFSSPTQQQSSSSWLTGSRTLSPSLSSIVGAYATLSINLSEPIEIDSFIMEHVPKKISTTSNSRNSIQTAVQNFRVYGFEEQEANGIPHHLGSFRYDIDDGHYLQVFEVDQEGLSVSANLKMRSILLAIDSNWGADYTCLYRFRVQAKK